MNEEIKIDERIYNDYSCDGDTESANTELTAYDIAVFYNTYNLSSLMKWWNKRLIVPSFQRAYVWDHRKASEFVDSILRGLPVPSMFFYDDSDSNKLLVVDGQQRLTSLYKFIVEKKFNGKEFRLTGNIHPNWDKKSFDDLSALDRERLEDSLMNVTVMRQLKPENGQSSMYLAFQRFNTGGISLRAQEIRMAVSYGPLSEFVTELAEDSIFSKWDFLISKEDKKNNNFSKIQEIILRFWVLFLADGKLGSSSLRSSLDDFFSTNKKFDEGPFKRDGKTYYSKKYLKECFDTIYLLQNIDSDSFCPFSIPTVIFFESVWLGVAFRKREGKDVSDEWLISKIKNWSSQIGEAEFGLLFKPRRSSSIEAITTRVMKTKEYFLAD